ncbi:MAG: hypothetical protein DRP66_09300 [Planctomycetota bacterium]|nr:MAG: hypothetical protein DRP66_09300 [Planctomycetota bacterium]
MSFIRRLLFAALPFCMATAWAQIGANQPQIGYIYPAGARQGADVVITVAGQFLKGATDVYVSGQGVNASVIQYMRPPRNFNKEQRTLIQQRLKEVRDKRLAELSPKSPKSDNRPATPKPKRKPRPKAKPRPKQKTAAQTETPKKAKPAETIKTKMPNHPLLYDLENKSLRELAHISNIIFAPRTKQQLNRQISEAVLVRIKIDPGAEPGRRELRIKTATGLTNPRVFDVGLLPEVRELEPNNKQAWPPLRNLPDLPKEKPFDTPVLFNGQIMPGDVDRFRFRARRGRRLVIEAHARSLIPYLADAVPGWFQATLALYDADGKEVAFTDDYRFNPDPVLFYEIPKSGEYELEIRDSIYRGREDFVYRIAVGEKPFITQAFPLGGKAGVRTAATIDGWNLLRTRLPLDTQPGNQSIRQTAYHEGKHRSNSVPYAVDTLPEFNETESNDTTRRAQEINLPKIINGRIDKPGDVDVFRFKGRSGDKIVAEVFARRLNSPLDSLLRLTDVSGKVLQWNDDHELKEGYLHKDIVGLITHQADSYLSAELPADGVYYVHLADAQRHGSAAHAYRLRISAPQPDFALRTTPSSLSIRAGRMVPFSVHVLRKDGFDGEIEVVLKDAPAGFKLSGGRIPAGCSHIPMTLTAPAQAPDQPVALQLEGRARIGAQTIIRPAVPAEDMMQAFLYRHLVPANELLVAVNKSKWRVPPVELATDGPVRIPAGGSTRVRLKTRKRPALKQMQLELRDPPEGLTLHNVAVVPEGLAFQLKADKDAMETGFEGNLIVEAFTQYAQKAKNGKPTGKKRRASAGFLPAIPIKIVQ